MSAGEAKQAGKSTTTTTEAGGLLEAAISATKQTERSRAEELLRNIGEAAPPVKEDTWTDIVARVDEVGPAPAAVATGRRRMVPMSVAAGLLIVAVGKE